MCNGRSDIDPQTALSNVVAPKAANDGFVHDSYLCQEARLIKGSQSSAFPIQRTDSSSKKANFVGNTRGSLPITFECPDECRPRDHKDWKLC